MEGATWIPTPINKCKNHQERRDQRSILCLIGTMDTIQALTKLTNSKFTATPLKDTLLISLKPILKTNIIVNNVIIFCYICTTCTISLLFENAQILSITFYFLVINLNNGEKVLSMLL